MNKPETRHHKNVLQSLMLISSDFFYQEQRANDALCQQFKQAVEPFSKWIIDQKDKITHSQGELDDQLAYVQQRIASLDADGAALTQVLKVLLLFSFITFC